MTHQRRANSYGYFAPERYADRGDASCRHEIALNPDSFVGESDREVISTLLHEMAHLWQHVHGVQRPRRAYHNREWAAKMCELGLMPSSTGKPGGQMTGSRMSHYVLEDGRYAQGFAALAATGWKLNLQSAARPSVIKGPGSKSRFTCPGCSWNVWGKPDTRVACLYCDMQMALSG